MSFFSISHRLLFFNTDPWMRDFGLWFKALNLSSIPPSTSAQHSINPASLNDFFSFPLDHSPCPLLSAFELLYVTLFKESSRCFIKKFTLVRLFCHVPFPFFARSKVLLFFCFSLRSPRLQDFEKVALQSHSSKTVFVVGVVGVLHTLDLLVPSDSLLSPPSSPPLYALEGQQFMFLLLVLDGE